MESGRPGPDAVNDNDADANNEIQTLTVSGNTLSLSNGGGSVGLPSTWKPGTNFIYYQTNEVHIGSSGAPEAKLQVSAKYPDPKPQLLLVEKEDDYASLDFRSKLGSNPWTIAALTDTSLENERLNFNHGSLGTFMEITGQGRVGVQTGGKPVTTLHVGYKRLGFIWQGYNGYRSEVVLGRRQRRF